MSFASGAPPPTAMAQATGMPPFAVTKSLNSHCDRRTCPRDGDRGARSSARPRHLMKPIETAIDSSHLFICSSL